jgi:phage terminase large subunit-like protein
VTDQLLKLKNGSVVTFRSADSGREKFQGLTRDWVHVDEEPPKPIFEEIVARVGAGRGLRVFISATLLPPEGMAGGISWLYEELIRPWQSGTRPDVAVFGASIYDNPHLGREEIARLEALYPEGSAVRRIRLNGEWLPGLTCRRSTLSWCRRTTISRSLASTLGHMSRAMTPRATKARIDRTMRALRS